MTKRDQIIEVMAMALCREPDNLVEIGYWVIDGRGSSLPDGAAYRRHEKKSVPMWQTKIPQAERQLTALESSGYIVRPREATEVMLSAAEECDGHTVYDINASAETHDTAMTEAWDKEQNDDNNQ